VRVRRKETPVCCKETPPASHTRTSSAATAEGVGDGLRHSVGLGGSVACRCAARGQQWWCVERLCARRRHSSSSTAPPLKHTRNSPPDAACAMAWAATCALPLAAALATASATPEPVLSASQMDWAWAADEAEPPPVATAVADAEAEHTLAGGVAWRRSRAPVVRGRVEV
jgi:hypothetical protein